jgi:pimeloyl-ACP methyl ester carboxylesterase
MVTAELERHGHQAIAVDLPCEDQAAGLPEYLAATLDAIGGRDELVVVAQSLGAFTGAGLVPHADVRRLVLLAPMIPTPGETPGEWWANTGHTAAVAELTAKHGPPSSWDVETLQEVFLHDVAPEVVAQAGEHMREQGGGVFGTPLLLDAWPDVPTHVVIGSHDRFFPPDFQRRLCAERLGIVPEEIATGHMPMLARPGELTQRLLAHL